MCTASGHSAFQSIVFSLGYGNSSINGCRFPLVPGTNVSVFMPNWAQWFPRNSMITTLALSPILSNTLIKISVSKRFSPIDSTYTKLIYGNWYDAALLLPCVPSLYFNGVDRKAIMVQSIGPHLIPLAILHIQLSLKIDRDAISTFGPVLHYVAQSQVTNSLITNSDTYSRIIFFLHWTPISIDYGFPFQQSASPHILSTATALDDIPAPHFSTINTNFYLKKLIASKTKSTQVLQIL